MTNKEVEVNFLAFPHDMVFVLPGCRILFHSMLLNKNNQYWHNWFNSPIVKKQDIKIYKCSDSWHSETLILVLKHFAGLCGIATEENKNVQYVYQLNVTIHNFDKIYEIAHEINDYVIMKKVCGFIRLEISDEDQRKINCKFLDQMLPNELITEINNSWNVIDFKEQLVKPLSKFRLNIDQKNIARKLYAMLDRFMINETDLLEFLIFIHPPLMDKPISPQMLKNIIRWKE